MAYLVASTEEFDEQFDSLDERAQDAILASVRLLQQFGHQLGRPHVDTIKDSKFPNMKELRIRINPPYRIFFLFDVQRQAVLLWGGDKANTPKFYQRELKKAETVYERYLASAK